MKTFDAYAKYYDLLYRDKDYKSEAEYISGLIRNNLPEARSILDLGCGTGKHDMFFADDGFDVTGVELSREMFDIANEGLAKYKKNNSKIRFINSDIRNLDLGREFDIITSLFHVLNYQTTNEDISLTLETVRKNLADKGKFICDFWYGPAVLNERPESRIKKFEDEEVMIERYATPHLIINENLVEIDYRIVVRDLNNQSTHEINEKHRMRYLFLPELEYFLDNAGLQMDSCEEWMKGNKLSDNSWYGLSIISKK